MKCIREVIASGYLAIVLLIGCIIYLWFYEWQNLETIEVENQRMNTVRQKIHNTYEHIIELSLLSETVIEWEERDGEYYHIKRMEVDSMMRQFQSVYKTERIDSICHLLKEKEEHLQNISRLYDEQKSLNEEIAGRIPIIARKSTQEQPQKTKRKGFLGIFGKKEKPKPTNTTVMLYSLNKDVISQYRIQSRELEEYADSLANRNLELNRQLQTLIQQMDNKVQTDLQEREAEISTMREKSFLQVGGITGAMLLLLRNYILYCTNGFV